MKIHALTTGTVQVKHSFLFAGTGMRRQLNLLLPDEWSAPLPIHAWAVEHDGRVILVDAGEVATVNNVPFARFDVAPEQELPHALAAAGLDLGDVDQVVLTHMHGDHMDGTVHVRGPVLVHDEEIKFQHTAGARFFQKVLRQPIPSGVDFQPLRLDDGAFGAFERSKRLTDDGRVVVVATPGHTPAHVSVMAIDDDGRHVLLAGDTTDTLQQLHDRRHDAIGPKPKVNVATIDRILAHAREHPTVYLPSHDAESAARLSRSEQVAEAGQ
jgi:glyoxylase-like metal-dependent hydrolase (beta-lactamase superfamily II)